MALRQCRTAFQNTCVIGRAAVDDLIRSWRYDDSSTVQCYLGRIYDYVLRDVLIPITGHNSVGHEPVGCLPVALVLGYTADLQHRLGMGVGVAPGEVRHIRNLIARGRLIHRIRSRTPGARRKSTHPARVCALLVARDALDCNPRRLADDFELAARVAYLDPTAEGNPWLRAERTYRSMLRQAGRVCPVGRSAALLAV